MMSLRTTALRTATRLATSPSSKAIIFMSVRALSTQSIDAVEKLKSILEEYRRANYTQELASRFKKEVFRAASEDHPDRIAISGLEHLLSNIGAAGRIPTSDIEAIFTELGNENHEIPVQQMAGLL